MNLRRLLLILIAMTMFAAACVDDEGGGDEPKTIAIKLSWEGGEGTDPDLWGKAPGGQWIDYENLTDASTTGSLDQDLNGSTNAGNKTGTETITWLSAEPGIYEFAVNPYSVQPIATTYTVEILVDGQLEQTINGSFDSTDSTYCSMTSNNCAGADLGQIDNYEFECEPLPDEVESLAKEEVEERLLALLVEEVGRSEEEAEAVCGCIYERLVEEYPPEELDALLDDPTGDFLDLLNELSESCLEEIELDEIIDKEALPKEAVEQRLVNILVERVGLDEEQARELCNCIYEHLVDVYEPDELNQLLDDPTSEFIDTLAEIGERCLDEVETDEGTGEGNSDPRDDLPDDIVIGSGGDGSNTAVDGSGGGSTTTTVVEDDPDLVDRIVETGLTTGQANGLEPCVREFLLGFYPSQSALDAAISQNNATFQENLAAGIERCS